MRRERDLKFFVVIRIARITKVFRMGIILFVQTDNEKYVQDYPDIPD